MLLRKVVIRDFLSIRGDVELDLDPAATILLGANDHGKSNVLKAICCLNEDTPINKEDGNWDQPSEPYISFEFSLSDAEQDIFLKVLPAKQEPTVAVDDTDPDNPVGMMIVSVKSVDDPIDNASPDEIDRRMQALRQRLEESPRLTLVRTGAGTLLRLMGVPVGNLPKEFAGALRPLIPRVELFQPNAGELQDAVQADQIKTTPFEFLQGVFFYAGLDPMNMDSIFQQDDSTMRILDEASKRLDLELRNLWAQGRELDLHFELRHRQNRIEFLANDPAVKARKARMSKRSTGVTQFFRLSMTLHARRRKNPANRYIYLFDEPGVFLHPQGQKDLIQVFEQLSTDAQLVYATHSLFMLNQNFPERHRLVVRNENGTTIDQKPYRANWRLATDALGVYLTANILFSSALLLVEGDSDPLYIFELLRRLNQSGAIDVDANMLGVLSYSDAPNLRFLLQQFARDSSPCRIMVLADGDKAGKRILEASKELCDRLGVKQLSLNAGMSIEDYILDLDIFLSAAEDTVRNALDAEKKYVPPDLKDQLAEKWKEHSESQQDSTGRWFQSVAKSIVKSEVSKVALARNYAFRCRESARGDVDPQRSARAIDFCQRVARDLGIPEMKAARTLSPSS